METSLVWFTVGSNVHRPVLGNWNNPYFNPCPVGKSLHSKKVKGKPPKLVKTLSHPEVFFFWKEMDGGD